MLCSVGVSVNSLFSFFVVMWRWSWDISLHIIRLLNSLPTLLHRHHSSNNRNSTSILLNLRHDLLNHKRIIRLQFLILPIRISIHIIPEGRVNNFLPHGFYESKVRLEETKHLFEVFVECLFFIETDVGVAEPVAEARSCVFFVVAEDSFPSFSGEGEEGSEDDVWIIGRLMWYEFVVNGFFYTVAHRFGEFSAGLEMAYVVWINITQYHS